jgi:uncharacterized membrane protein
MRIKSSDYRETPMKTNIISGSTIAVAAVALVLAGAAPAAAKHHHHHRKDNAEKHKCNKDGCAAKKDDKAAPAPAEPAGGAK